MANLITIGDNKYFKSKDVKVFPSSFRGAFKSGTATTAPEITFDPEARLNSEANFILPTATAVTDSYIVEYNQSQNTISFVLGGYHFVISQVADYLDEIKNKYVGLTLREVTLQDPGSLELQFQHDSHRSTKLLNSWETSTTHILDVLSEDDCYCFTGLKILNSDFDSDGADATLKLFNSDKTVNLEAFLPNIQHGSGAITMKHGEGLVAAGDNQTVIGKYNKNKTDSLFEIGCGTANAASSRKNAVEVSATKTAINTPTSITGATDIKGTVTVTGKVKSNTTSSSDTPDTLVTKSYIDNMIGGINTPAPTPPSGGGGIYITGVTQSGAKISTTQQGFDTSISNSSTDGNAPTAKAVKDYVTATVNDLDVAEVGGSNTYIQKIKEVDGKIEATPKSFSTSISASSDNSTAPTAKAVYDYIESIRGGLESKITDDIEGAVKGIQITSSGSAGSYIKEIKQSEGKIEPTLQAFDTSITSTASNNNAPTTYAVRDFTTTVVSQVWYNNIVRKTSDAGLSSLKSIILDAIYPVGSIYMQYIAKTSSAPSECPIKGTLGGNWSLIEAGKFLCAANNTGNGIYRHGWGFESSDKAGSADAVSVKHDHSSVSTTTESANLTLSDYSKSGYFTLRTCQSNDAKMAPTWDGTVVDGSSSSSDNRASVDYNGKSTAQNIKINISHGHTLTDSKHKHTVEIKGGGGVEGTNKNLPPYIAVYMWRRTS